MSKEAFYFQHDYDAVNDPKIQALISDYGASGYGIYWRIIEMLHSESNHQLPRKKYISKAIAKQMDASAEMVSVFIDNCINEYDLLRCDEDFFWSERVKRNMKKREEISRKRSEAGKRGASVKQMQANAKQNKAKERKRKEKKGKESFIIVTDESATKKQNSIADLQPKESHQTFPLNGEVNSKRSVSDAGADFEEFWNIYDKKVGKKKSKTYWNKLTAEEKDIAIRHAKSYVDTRDKQYRKDPERYLRDRSFNDEIISDSRTNKNQEQQIQDIYL